MGAFDDLIPGGESGAFDDLIPAKKKDASSASAAEMAKSGVISIIKGVPSTMAGVMRFARAPVETAQAAFDNAALALNEGASKVTGGRIDADPALLAQAQESSRIAAEARQAGAQVQKTMGPLQLLSLVASRLQPTFEGAEQKAAKWRQEEAPNVEQQQQAISDADGVWDTLKAIAKHPAGLIPSLGESVPAMAAGAGLSRAAAGRAAAAGGAEVDVVRAASNAGVASEAGFAALQSAHTLEAQVLATPLDALQANSQRFRDLLAQTQDPEAARRRLAAEVADRATGLVGLGTAAGSRVTSRLFGGDETAKILAGVEKPTLRDAARNAVQEGVEEVLQGVPQDLSEHGAMLQADPAHKLDLGGSAVQNFAAGAAMGGPSTAGKVAWDRARGLMQDRQPPAQDQGGGEPPAGPGGSQAMPAPAVEPAAAATEAEKALFTPRALTSLDRVQELDADLQRVLARQAELDGGGYGPMFDTERQELAGRAQELGAERADLVKDWPRLQAGGGTRFTTEAGAKVDAQYALAEADDLVTSHDTDLRADPRFPKELQPRERDRAASEMQISGIVQRLDPARLGMSADAANGAPIIGADGLVESGNARTIALKRVYEADGQSAEEYRAYLRENAGAFGLAPSAVDAVRHPVLVRVRRTPVDRAEFARQANAATVAQMSPSEQARADAKRIDTMEDLQPDEAGDFSGPASRPFVRRFLAKLPVTEQSGMIDAAGNLSTSGYARIRNAVLAKAYGDSAVLQRMVESMDDNLRNVSKALIAAAPRVAAMREAIDAGVRHQADITPDLLASVEELAAIKDRGSSVQDALAQTDLVGDRYSPETREILAFLADNMRRPKRMADFVTAYMEALDEAGDPNQAGLFGEADPPSKSALMGAAKRSIDGQATAPAAGDDAGRGSNPGADPKAAGPAGGESAPAPRDGRGDQEAGAAAASEWVAFPPGSGTLGIPRAEMPQIKGQHRGALVQFLEARGIGHEADEVPAATLKPTQAEFSRAKLDRFVQTGVQGERSVLVSSDGYVLDGHHQWLGHGERGEDVPVLRLDAPIRELLAAVNEFPSTKRSEGAGDLLELRRTAVADFKAAAADLADILTKNTRAAIVPEDTPGLMPALVKLFDAGIRIVGTDMKRATAWVQAELRKMPEFKALWNRIAPATYRKAALRALEAMQDQPKQAGLFDTVDEATDALQGDLFAEAPAVRQVAKNLSPAREESTPKPDMRDLGGNQVDINAPDFGLDPWPMALQEGDPLLVSTDKKASVEIDGESIPREVLRADIVEQAFENAVPVVGRKPVAYVMGGGGASGKGTIKSLLQDKGVIPNTHSDPTSGVIELDPDEIKARIPEYEALIAAGDSRAASVVHEESSDIAKRILAKAIGEDGSGSQYDLVYDVTLGDPKKGVALLQRLKAAGYEVRLFGVVVDPVLAVVRADGRARKNGRYVPTRDLLRAHKGFALAFDEYAGLVDHAELFENSFGPRSIARTDSNGSLDVLDSKAYNLLVSRAEVINENAKTLAEASPQSWEDPGASAGVDRSGGGRGRQEAGSSGNRVGEDRRSGNPAPPQAAQGGLNADGQPGQGRDQAQGAEAARRPGGKRQAERVRGGTGQPDLFAGGEPDAGAARAGEVGQAGSDGVRGADEDGRQPELGSRARRVAGVSAGRELPAKSGLNYSFGPDDLTYEGSWAKKAAQNVEAVELLKKLQAEKRQATREEQQVLAKFVGWGSSEIANALFGKKLDAAKQAMREYDDAAAAMARLGQDYLQGAERSGYGRSRRYADDGFYAAVGVLRAADKLSGYQFPDRITRAELDAARPDAGTRRYVELRDRLKAAMTPEEWTEAARSTQYAHYTSKAVVSSMWKAVERMGFAGGTVLEPGAGIGVFPGLMPQGMAASSLYTGIEFDSITGGILQQLFPDEQIRVESFVDTKLPRDFYDVAVGNPPFSQTKILGDPEYAKRAMSLHDYFFAKTIDRVKPRGLVVFVTSRYTMDKLDDKARQYLAERADLVGAIRLPQTAFKQNAGTEVVTDVLFLRKKVKGEKFEHAKAWLKTAEAKDAAGNTLMVKDKDGKERPAMINEFFAANPDMVLGQNANTGSMYSDKEYTVTPLPGDIETHFAKAVEKLPAGIYQAPRGSQAEAAKVREIDFNPKAKKEGNYYVTDAGVLMVRESGVGQRVELKSQAQSQLIKDFVPLRDALKQAHYDQLTDGAWEQSLAALQKAYKAFTDKHGPVNQFKVRKVNVKKVDEDTGEAYTDEEQRRSYPILDALKDDPDWTLVAALESINDDSGEIKPSDFLNKRVLGKPVEPQVKNPADALLTVLNDVGHVDMAAVAERAGVTEQEAIEALGTAVYQDPSRGWVMADEYLSGNVKRKLEEARVAARTDRRFERNVTALEAAQPAPKSPSQINVGIGMNWIPGQVYQQFLQEVTKARTSISWNARTKEWVVQELGGGRTAEATEYWGTDRRNVVDLMEHALTGRKIIVKDTDPKTKTSSVNESATEAANEKLNKLREAFQDWIWKDTVRTDELVRLFNDKFNTTVARTFDGRHLTLPGSSKTFKIFDHVKRGAWRIIQKGNTYLAHAVGSGKTFQMVIAAMEQKRLGLIKKPMVVVPNHMLQQFASEWQQLYPAARLMVADETNFHTDNRRRFVSRVALSDLDGVIITHSAFKLLDLDPEFKREMIDQQMEFLQAALEEVGGDNADKRDPKVKQIQRQLEAFEQKLEKLLSSAGKDANVRFDELGVDFLMVDEAHEFRKLDFATSRQVKGLSPQGSARAFDLFMKTRWLEKQKPGRSLVMASGTPITNTVAELYSVQKFMDPQALEDRGMEDFDSWAAMFARESTRLEANAAGTYEPVTRFNKFVNVPELTQMFRDFADVLTADHLAALLGDKRPKVAGGARKLIVTPKVQAYAGYQKELARRMEISREWRPSKDEPNNPDPIIRIIGDGRLAAIDMRFADPSLPSDPGSKLNRMIDEVIAKAKATADMQFRGPEKRDAAGEKIPDSGDFEPNKGATMMVFSDLGFGAGVAASRGFNARAWFEKRLRDAGIPPSQVAFMSDYKKSTDKLKLFKDVNQGRVRILVGSSKNMGTGVNAQQRLKALFHLDSPWYPSDLEQREGRIIRQGNKNKEVEIYAYAAKGSYDEVMWQMLASKQQFIDLALSGDQNVRELEDLSSQSEYEMAAALVAEDQRVLQLAGLNADVAKLQRLYQAHEETRARNRDRYQNAISTIDFLRAQLPKADAAAAKVEDLSGDKFKAKIGTRTVNERKAWVEALEAVFKDWAGKQTQDTRPVGSISGFDVVFRGTMHGGNYMASLDLELPGGPFEIMLPGSPVAGVAMRAQNAVSDVAMAPVKMRERITELAAQRDALVGRIDAPFPMAQLLAEKQKEAADLAAEIARGPEVTEQTIMDDWAARTGAITPLFSRASRPGAGVKASDLEAMAAVGRKAMPGLPPVVVLQSPADAPQALREFIEARGAMGDAEGALHDGSIYLFAANLADMDRAEHVLLQHEAQHAGLTALLGNGKAAAMQAIANQNAAVRRKAESLRKLNPGMDTAEAVEEVLVEMSGDQLVRLTGWRRLVERVRDALQARGMVRIAGWLDRLLQGSLSEQQRADLAVAQLLRDVRQVLQAPRAGQAGEVGSRLARAPAQSQPLGVERRAEDIVQDRVGRAAPLDKLARGLTRLTGVERLASAIYDKTAFMLDRYTPEKIKAGVISDYGVPQAVIDQRALLQGRQRVQLRKAGALLDKLATLTRAESRVAYAWMNEADPAEAARLMDDLPAESVQVLGEVSMMIERLSKEAIAMGQLSADAYARNRFAYLRRSYVKHVLPTDEKGQKRRSRAIAILGEQYKGRGLTEAAPMRQLQNSAPEWWMRKVVPGKADASLKGQQFVRLERRLRQEGAGVAPLQDAEGPPNPGAASPKEAGRLQEIHYYPAGEPLPAKYADWHQAGVWEVRDIKGGDVIFWRDFTKAEREKMGEIDEARFAIAKTLHAMIHDVEVGRYLEWMAHSQAVKPGAAVPGVVVEGTERYRDTYAPGEWVRVPDTVVPGTSVPKYGKLAGRYLPGPVWNDLRQVVSMQSGPLGETYQKVLSAWKSAKTALSPAVHTNNVMSNFVMADWHDVGARHVGKALRILLAAQQGDGKGLIGRTGNAAVRAGIQDRDAAREIVNRYKDSGGDIGGWVTAEIAKEQIDPLLQAIEAEARGGQAPTLAAQIGVMSALQHALHLRFPEAWSAFKGGRVSGKAVQEAQNLLALYQAEDDVFRLAAWLKAKEDGRTDLEAGKAARTSFLDYRVNAPWIQMMRQTAWPFVSFSYRAIPMLLETAGKRPHKLLKLMAIAGALNALGTLMAGGGGGGEDERKLLPEEKAGSIWGLVPKLIRMPWNDANGSPVYLDIRRFIPVGDVFDVGAGQSALPVLPVLQPGGPLVIFGEFILNKSAFTGKPITLETDTTGEKTAKMLDHLWKAFAPNLLGVPGTYATTGVLESMEGRTDAFGREMSTAQAVASAFGVKLGSYPADVLRRNLTAKAQAEMREIDLQISQLKRQRQTNRLTPEEFADKVREQQAKKQEIQRKLGEKVSAARAAE